MNEKLIMSLIDKGVIKPKTNLTAAVSTVDTIGQRHSSVREFTLRCVVENEKGIFFAAYLSDNSFDKCLYKVPLLSVKTVDGMDIKSLARVYGLRADGSPSEAKICPITGQPVRRGRKPKWVKEKMARIAAGLEEAEDFDEDDEDEDFDEVEHAA